MKVRSWAEVCGGAVDEGKTRKADRDSIVGLRLDGRTSKSLGGKEGVLKACGLLGAVRDPGHRWEQGPWEAGRSLGECGGYLATG